MWPIFGQCDYVTERGSLPPHRIRRRIAEHLQKRRLSILFAHLQRIPPQPAQAIRPAEDAGDAMLFGEWG